MNIQAGTNDKKKERYSNVNDIGKVQDKRWQQYVQASLLALKLWVLPLIASRGFCLSLSVQPATKPTNSYYHMISQCIGEIYII